MPSEELISAMQTLKHKHNNEQSEHTAAYYHNVRLRRFL